ncbi:unnamed protein product [Arabidopsis halleri]
MAMMVMSNLPNVLVDECLSRVPLESVRAVRLTSINWNTLSKSGSFTKTHLGKLAEEEEKARELGEFRMIVMMDYNVYLTNFVVGNQGRLRACALGAKALGLFFFYKNSLDRRALTKPLGKLTCQVKISQVFHCDGLLLCVFKGDSTRLVVWNPYLCQTRSIQTTHFDGLDTHDFKYAIGYEDKNNHRTYKILRFRGAYLGYRYIGAHLLFYEIYDFDSDLWTTHNLTAYWNIGFCDSDRGVSLKGNTYWCATDALGIISLTVCYDFTRNRFGGVQDLPFRAPYKQLVTLSCVRDEKLSVLIQSMDTFVIDVWITDKIEEHKVLWDDEYLRVNKFSWSKFLSVDMGPLSDLRISDGSFFIDEEKKLAMVFNKDSEERSDTVKIFGEDGYFTELDLGEPSDKKCWPLVCSYVPSLVQIKLPEAGRDKRKRQSY